MDIVFILGPSSPWTGHNELRYALRSLKHMPHRHVWLVGCAPAWAVNVRKVDVPQVTGPFAKWLHAKENLRAACEAPGMPDQFYLWHDDMWITRPIDKPPLFHVGTLSYHAQRVRSMYPDSKYAQNLDRTSDLLRCNGILDPLSFEAHIPAHHTRDGLLEALELCEGNPRLHERSVDMNMRGIAAERGEDVKVYDGPGPFMLPPIVSASDTAWRGPFGARMRGLLSSPGPYER
jgi:hypothetical protein